MEKGNCGMDAWKGMEEGGIGGEHSDGLDREVGETGISRPAGHEEERVGGGGGVRGWKRVGEARRGVDGNGEDGEGSEEVRD